MPRCCRIIYRLSFVALLAAQVSAAELQFAPTFTSHMVLQREVPIILRGQGPVGAMVDVSIDEVQQQAKVDAQGNWTTTFEPLLAGGPHQLRLRSGPNEVVLEDVLIGDVWICSGQSNMQMGLAEAEGGAEALASVSSDIPVRLLMVPKTGSEEPKPDIDAEWNRCTPDALEKFSAVGWFFAAHLRQDEVAAEVPLGLIDTSFGGTAVEGWTPAGTLPDMPEDQLSDSMFGMPPGHLYNGMIAPLLSYPIKGVLWYQGESNAGRPGAYSVLLQNMMAQWRQKWNQPELPFFIVQLPAFEGRIGGLDFSWLREAQADACQKTSNAWLAVTFDTTDGYDLHPREKEEIGRRLSLLARREVYGQDIVAHSPAVVDVVCDGDQVVIEFEQPLAEPDSGPLRGFAIRGAQAEYRYAEATLHGNTIQLRAEGVSAPQFVRYAWGAIPTGNLRNQAGLPVAPFRTDHQPPDALAFQPLPISYKLEAPAYALESGSGGSIRSLVVRGQQFLSNEPGGGTSFPSFFGPRNLANARLVGPSRFSASDGMATLEVLAQPDSMTWTLSNRGNDSIEFHIVLTPQVEVDQGKTVTTLGRDGAKLSVSGVERVDEGHKLVIRVPGRASVAIEMKVLPE